MKKVYTIFILCITILMLNGCTTQTIDASSDESLKESISDVRQSLSDEKTKQFDEALRIVMFQDFDLKNFMLGANVGGALELSKAKNHLDGKTADEIINESKLVQEKRLEKKKEDLKVQIRELEDKEIQAKEFKNKIIISNEKIYEEKEMYRNNRVVEFDITNNTIHSISRIEIIGKFTSEDRDIPWSEITLSDYIPGGLLSNETRNLKIKFTMYSYKGMTIDEVPSNAKLKVVINRVYDDKNIQVYPINGFNEFEQRKLDNLIEQYNNLEGK